MSSLDLTLSRREIAALFILLKDHEPGLNKDLQDVFGRISEILFAFLSIDEIERIEDLYAQGYLFEGRED